MNRLREVAAVAIAVPTLVVLAADDVVRRVRRWWATPPDLDDVARYRDWRNPFVAQSGGDGVRTETLPKDGA